MAKAYYSTVFSQSADDIWTVIRDFNNYAVWVDGAGESHIEGGKSGDAIGAVRNVLYNGKRIRQSLLALSDPDRAMSYAFCDADALPVQHYRATLKLTPGDRRRPRLRRMVGDIRLHAGASRRMDGVFPRLVRPLARLAAAVCRGQRPMKPVVTGANLSSTASGGGKFFTPPARQPGSAALRPASSPPRSPAYRPRP
jgi:hypothetical protein